MSDLAFGTLKLTFGALTLVFGSGVAPDPVAEFPMGRWSPIDVKDPRQAEWAERRGEPVEVAEEEPPAPEAPRERIVLKSFPDLSQVMGQLQDIEQRTAQAEDDALALLLLVA